MGVPALSPIPRRSLVQATLERLRRAILGGELPEGCSLPEAATAAKLGVSRVPVREALVELERQGLVEFDGAGRAGVCSSSPGDVRELLTLRAALQALAARHAAERVQTRDLRRLESLVERTGRAADLTELSALDAAFHDEIVVIAGHRRLSRAWADLRAPLELWLSRLHRRRERLKRDVRDETLRSHREFLKLLARRNPAQAARWMERHCLSWTAQLREDA